MYNKALWVVFGALLGLGIAQLVVNVSSSTHDELRRPLWPGAVWQWFVPPGAFILVLLPVGIQSSYWLGATIGMPAAAVAWVLTAMAKNRYAKRVEDEAISFLIELEGALSMGSTLQDAMTTYVQETDSVVANEVQRFALRPLAAGRRLVEVLTALEGAPRYEGHAFLHRLLSNLARGARGGFSPEEMWQHLRTFEDVSDMVMEMRREMYAESEQMRMARWIVSFLLVGGVVAVGIFWPQAREHWFNELPGQVSLLLVSFLGATAIVAGEWMGKPQEVDF